MSLSRLVDLGMLSVSQAACLVDHLTDGGSIVVAANPQGAGKSTLAHALACEVPADRVRVYLRGMYEPFDWVEGSAAGSTTILVNEMSPHLPIYAWAETLRRALALGEGGYQIVATIHADSVEEVVAQLTAYPISATAAQVAALDVVVFLTVTTMGATLERRVGSIVSLAVDDVTGGLIARPLLD